jgi:fructose-specific phosphotransferase system IIC component
MPEVLTVTPQIPTSVYVIIGTLIIANLGTILTVLTFIFKGGMFVAETRSGIKDAKEAAVRAHKRIDKLEPKTIEGEI